MEQGSLYEIQNLEVRPHLLPDEKLNLYKSYIKSVENPIRKDIHFITYTATIYFYIFLYHHCMSSFRVSSVPQ